jgi:predicted RNase H-like HicB family nuclease
MKYTFTYIIEQDEDGFYVTDVPALPGCHTRILEAIRLYLDDYITIY